MADQDSTLPASNKGAGDEPVVPQGNIGRFVVRRALGSGGMGVVVAAHDPSLDREVAIKVLRSYRGGDDQGSARLRKEAQAMARVQHPNVCAIYEIGSVGEQLFVAMELVDGQTLRGWLKAKPRSVPEVLDLFLAAGRGLEAVHAAGLVHRDFKPDNVLVGKDGRPRVSDFGLVSTQARVAGGPTVTSSQGGTPGYMAPEQLRGEGDARSDQFAFCVALYEALHGERPFPSDAPADERHAPAKPPNTSGVPAWLNDAIARGLRVRPDERWPSVGALLGALAHDAAARRRRILSIAALLLVGAVGVFGWFQTRTSAARRVKAAQELGQAVQTIRSLMRTAHLLPLHDIKPDRDRVRALMKRIESQARELGADGHGASEFALGSGLLAIGEREQARPHLEAAWAAGERTPDLAYDLGLVFGTAYQRASMDAPPLDEAGRQKRDEQLKRTLRDPALAYLRAAGGAADTSPAYVEALIAFYERRNDDALARAEAAFREVPTLYEAGLLAANVGSRRVDQALRAGDLKLARARAAETEAAYRRVQEIGRSDEAVYRLYGDYTMASASLANRFGDDPLPVYARVLKACDEGRRADSEAVWPDEMEAYVHWQIEQAQMRSGVDPRPALKKAIAAAERALARNPKSFHGRSAAGEAWLNMANDWDLVHGADPRESIRRAIESFQGALAIRPDMQSDRDLGIAYQFLAMWQAAHGIDSTAAFGQAVNAFDEALRIDPAEPDPHLYACEAHAQAALAMVDRGLDPEPTLARAEQRCAAAHQLAAGMPEEDEYRGLIEMVRARWALFQGSDPLPAWERADAHYAALLKVDAKRARYLERVALAAAERAEVLSARGLAAEAALARARTAAAEAVKLEPGDAGFHRAQAFAEQAAARAAVRRGKDPARAIADGLAAVERAVAIKVDDAESLTLGAALELVAARWRAARGQSAESAMTAGQALATRALTIHPTLARALAVRSALSRQAGDTVAADTALAAARAANPRIDRDRVLAR